MPTETPSLNSTRILRAYRLNSVEHVKLRNELYVLDKSRRREIRLANQDIRMINLTLDYIKSSSGYSPEGLPPNYVDKSKRQESGPMFLYGDRVQSRKFGKKLRRVQSAFTGGFAAGGPKSIEDEETGSQHSRETRDSAQSEITPKRRPKSSPPKALATFNDIEPDTWIAGTKPRNSNSESDQLPVTLSTDDKTYLTLQVSDVEDKLKDLSSNVKNDVDGEASPEPEKKLLSGRPRSRHRGELSSRNQEMTKKVNETRVAVMKAKKSKPDPVQAWASNVQTNKEKESIEFKKNLNENRNNTMNTKLAGFMDAYPLKRY